MSLETTIRHDLLERVREVENVFIAMADGARLAARLFLPADRKPAPAILEYIPYRKRDFMRERDEPMHRYFAAHGYAVARVDVRGSGDSDGVLADEYSEPELDDGVEIVDWISKQPWCDGAVGMMGISWGGFNALQVAARRPAALRAILTLCASDDRYADDAHYMGGCLLNENLQWGSILTAYAAMPPDPEIVGERWREMWRARLEAVVAFPERWARHPHRDAYWRRGSVCEDYGAVACPVYVVGGWADGYSNAVGRLLAGLRVPKKGLIGPWAHTFPHRGRPGPAIGFLQEALRWWDHWLRGRDTGILREPMLRVWMQSSVPPAPEYDERPGRWVAEESWPSPRIARRALTLDPAGTLGGRPAGEARLEIQSPQPTGVTGGSWCAMGSEGEMPIDQRPDDGRSLVFDGEPLAAPLEILGAPELHLAFDCNRPVAHVAVRLNEIFPDGTSARVSYGVLNLTHRDSHEAPAPLRPGRRYEAVVRLNHVAHAFAAGNRIRVAISTAYWPMVWPEPEPVVLGVHAGASRLVLPARPVRAEDASLRPFAPPESGPVRRATVLRPSTLRRTIERDLPSGDVIYRIFDDGGEFDGAALLRLDDIDLEVGFTMLQRYRIGETDPLSAEAEIVAHTLLRRADWAPELRGRIALRATARAFVIEARVTANDGPREVFVRDWKEEIARDLV